MVTGGSAGIGLGIISHILQHNPKRLLFLSNKETHAEEAKEHLKEYGDITTVDWIQCNLDDLHQVKTVAESLREKEPEIDVLVLNAGIGVGPYAISRDGYDTHFQTNVLSQFLLVKTLLPNLKSRAQSTKDARIVFQSSSLHDTAVSGVQFANIDEINTDVGGLVLYDRTKLANILVAFKLNRDLHAEGVKGIYVNATHPGAVGTDQQKQAPDAYGAPVAALQTVLWPLMKDPIDEGCRPALFAATMPEIVEESITGKYIIPDKKVVDPSPKAQDEELGERVWKLCNEMLDKTLGSKA